MIIEGIVTSISQGNEPNVAPMGPIVHGDFERLTLRPFQGSTTFRNLMETNCGVFHVVDRTHLIAEAAIGRLTRLPPTEAARRISGVVLSDCCRWFEFRIVSRDTSDQRSVMEAEIIHTEERRPFLGFNRARHAVIEAAILATRTHILAAEEVLAAFSSLQSAVDKTGDSEEKASFQMLQQFVERQYQATTSQQGTRSGGTE
jgi:hypothetical protein